MGGYIDGVQGLVGSYLFLEMQERYEGETADDWTVLGQNGREEGWFWWLGEVEGMGLYCEDLGRKAWKKGWFVDLEEVGGEAGVREWVWGSASAARITVIVLEGGLLS